MNGEKKTKLKTSLDVQVGGDHYKNMGIQPVEYAMANNLNGCEYSVVKYISRHRNKDGLKDLMKAKHFIDMLIDFEYPEEAVNPSNETDNDWR